MTSGQPGAGAPAGAGLDDLAARAATAIAHARQLAERHTTVHAASADVAGAAQAARDEAAATHALLQTRVAALAAGMRRDGAPPERMVVAVKDAVRTATPPGTDPRTAVELMSGAVRWGIEAYYAA